MTTRYDVKVDFSDSPRVAMVNAPSQEFNAQDIVDTLRINEETFRGQSESKLLNASGKESLGGGVEVGITVELQNTEIAFQGRTTPVEDSTVTSTTSPVVAERQTLIDTNGNFTTSGVHRGALVINFTDGSIAEVRNIISDTELVTRGLVNGTDNLFEAGDAYQIFKVYQCEVLGGNVVGVDDNGDEASPILPTAFTQVIRTASSSATTQNLLALEHASYNNGVTIDVVNGVAGTSYPIGTGLEPVNNLDDAHTIADERGLTYIYVVGALNITGAQNWVDGHIFKGTSPTTTSINVDPTAIVTNCEIWDAYVTGTVDSNFIIRNSIVGSVTFDNGFIWESSILGPITLSGGETHIINCWSQVPGTNTPYIDMGGSGQSLGLRNYTGGMEIRNKTGPEQVSMDINSGHAILDSTVTAGTIVIRGVGKLTDNSTGTTNVQSENFLQASVIQDGIERSTFNGSQGPGVTISPANGTDGTAWPIGTREEPCKTEQNFHAIAAARGFIHVYVVDDLVLVGDHSAGHHFIGDSPANVSLTINGGSPGADVSNCRFEEVFINGHLTGTNVIERCIVGNITGANGFILQSALTGTITVADNMSVENCWIAPSAVGQITTIDFDGQAKTVIFSDWGAGRVVVKNMVTGSFFGISGSGGRVVIDAVNTGGTVVYGGSILVDDTNASAVDLVRNSSVAGQVWEEKTAEHTTTGTFGEAVNVIEVTVANMSAVIDDLIKYQRNKSVIDPVLFTLTIFEDDGVTPLTVFDLKDENGVASCTSVFQRIPQISVGSP